MPTRKIARPSVDRAEPAQVEAARVLVVLQRSWT